jgi:hypothetical protein
MSSDEDKATNQEIMGLVMQYFDGNAERAMLWFQSPNPSLGDLSPHTLISMGRINKLAEFVRNAMAANAAAEQVKA